jgi:hypothetical protein
MKSTETDIYLSGIDTRALSALIIELNIARRNCCSYPEGHPVIDSSLRKAFDIYNALLSTREEFMIGVTRDSLMVEDVCLEKNNQVYRDFAGILFDHSIGALVLRPGLEIGELREFTRILNMKRDQLFEQGGIENIWKVSNISAISILAIHYDMLSAIEEETVRCSTPQDHGVDIWERFAKGLCRGLLSRDAGSGNDLDPELLASILNRQYETVMDYIPDYGKTITDIFQKDDIIRYASTHHVDLYYEKLAAFVGKMNPQLRLQFLNSTFDIKTSGRESLTEKILNRFSTDTIVDVLDELNRNQSAVPPVILGLLQRLGRHSPNPRKHPDKEITEHDDFYQKLRNIFREHASEEFIPAEYQLNLNRIIASEEIPLQDREEMQELMGTFDADEMESRISEILLLLFIDDPTAGDPAKMVENLTDMCGYFLETGDYAQLRRIIIQTRDDRFPVELRRNFHEFFSGRQFLEEVLNGLNTWGKTKFEDVRLIITEIGEPFTEVLLDRLAEEESMSLRRFLIERLQERGNLAADSVIRRFSDNRWYFLRNLIMIIRAVGDDSHIDNLRPLARHPNLRVRQETLKTLLHFHDPVAEQQILQDMENKDHEVRINAIRLSDKSNSQRVFDRLLSFLARPGFSARECELKCAAVQTLAEFGRSDALPLLTRILESRNLFHPVSLNRLKMEIIRSIERYPSEAAQTILRKIAERQDRLAEQAQQSLRSIAGR